MLPPVGNKPPDHIRHCNSLSRNNSKLLLKPFSLLLPTLSYSNHTGNGNYTRPFFFFFLLFSADVFTGDYGGGGGGSEIVCAHVCVYVRVCACGGE